MQPTPIKATFLRSRNQLLDAAIAHLGDKYYTRLSKNENCKKGKFIKTRSGEILEGAILFQQDTGRHILAAVTTFDASQLENRADWTRAYIPIPQPDRLIVFVESLIAGLLVYAGLIAYGTFEGSFVMAVFTVIIYYVAAIIRTHDLGRELRQSPNVSLYHFIPDCRRPAHESWLVVGDEIFSRSPHIEPQALSNLCHNEGIGLLIITQNDIVRVWNHPVHQNKFIETQFDVRLMELI